MSSLETIVIDLIKDRLLVGDIITLCFDDGVGDFNCWGLWRLEGLEFWGDPPHEVVFIYNGPSGNSRFAVPLHQVQDTVDFTHIPKTKRTFQVTIRLSERPDNNFK